MLTSKSRTPVLRFSGERGSEVGNCERDLPTQHRKETVKQRWIDTLESRQRAFQNFPLPSTGESRSTEQGGYMKEQERRPCEHKIYLHRLNTLKLEGNTAALGNASMDRCLLPRISSPVPRLGFMSAPRNRDAMPKHWDNCEVLSLQDLN